MPARQLTEKEKGKIKKDNREKYYKLTTEMRGYGSLDSAKAGMGDKFTKEHEGAWMLSTSLGNVFMNAEREARWRQNNKEDELEELRHSLPEEGNFEDYADVKNNETGLMERSPKFKAMQEKIMGIGSQEGQISDETHQKQVAEQNKQFKMKQQAEQNRIKQETKDIAKERKRTNRKGVRDNYKPF